MEHLIIYDLASGEDVGRGVVPDGMSDQQTAPQGCAMIVVPQAIWETKPVDLNMLAAHYLERLDTEAEATRQQFITAGSGQAMTYLRKETEAAAFLAGSVAPTPFLTAEATARGITVAALAAEVSARAAAWSTIGPAIEGARMGAKQAVKAAANIAAMHAAAQVDWAAVVNGGN